VLVAQVEAAGYTATLPKPREAEVSDDPDPTRSLRDRLLVSALLTVPVIALAMAPALQFRYWQWISLTLAAPVAVWGAWPFHRAAWKNLRHGSTTMDTLVSMGVLAAFGWSVWALLFGTAGEPGMVHPFTFAITRGDASGQIYLEVASGVTTFLLAGRYFEARSKRRAGAALRALLELGAKDVAVLRDGREQRIPVGRLAVGDRFVVRPGEKIATDGVVEEGRSAVDAALMTGESVPVDVGPGDAVVGATVNAGGRLVVRATRIGADTQLAQMAKLVDDAQSGKAPVQRLADRISGVFVPIVIALAVATFAFWLGTGAGVAAAFTSAVAVLVIACPCALGLATPTALLVGTGRGAKLGILIRGPEVLEATRRVDTIVLDKTGTVTAGRMALVDVHVADGTAEDEALRLAAAVEAASEHPVGAAIVAAAPAGPPVESFENVEGLGVQGVVDGHLVLVGRPALLERWSIALPPVLAGALADAQSRGRTAVAVAWDGAARAVLVVADTVKPTSADAVTELRSLALRPILLTGDNERAARSVADAVGIDEVIAEVLPGEKADVVERLQAEGRVVAMVGDGVNDAPALARADVGLAIGAGTDVAIESAGVVLASSDPRGVTSVIRLSRASYHKMVQNLAWAAGYNVVAIPLAAGVLAWAGITLSPAVGAILMSASTIVVALNAQLLRRVRLAP